MLPLAEVFCLKVFSPHLVWFPLDYTEQLGQQKSQIIYDVGVPNELAGPISGTRSHTALRGWGGGCLVGCQDIPSLLMASCVSNTHTTTTITTHTHKRLHSSRRHWFIRACLLKGSGASAPPGGVPQTQTDVIIGYRSVFIYLFF